MAYRLLGRASLGALPEWVPAWAFPGYSDDPFVGMEYPAAQQLCRQQKGYVSLPVVGAGTDQAVLVQNINIEAACDTLWNNHQALQQHGVFQPLPTPAPSNIAVGWSWDPGPYLNTPATPGAKPVSASPPEHQANYWTAPSSGQSFLGSGVPTWVFIVAGVGLILLVQR